MERTVTHGLPLWRVGFVRLQLTAPTLVYFALLLGCTLFIWKAVVIVLALLR